MHFVLRIFAAVCIAAGSLAVAVWGVSSLIGARSDLRAHSPVQLDKKTTLAGPFGALANVAEDAAPPPVAELMVAPDTLAPHAALAFARDDHAAPGGFAPMVIEHPQVAMDGPLPPTVPRLAALAPPSAEPRAPLARNGAIALPEIDSRTAVYDISARTVYMPNGRKLVAHSGLGDKMDDPRFVNEHNRGPTPPNIYELSLREQIFHGVRAIRLNPVDEGKMYGRAGILAHSYMLGPSGQSNGCVSFENYSAFLQAFMKGEVERMVVVTRLPKSDAPALMSMRQGRERYY